MVKVGDSVRAVRGPGGALQPEHRFIGQTGRVVGVQTFTRSCPCYIVEFEFGDCIEQDTIDLTCLEKVHA